MTERSTLVSGTKKILQWKGLAVGSGAKERRSVGVSWRGVASLCRRLSSAKRAALEELSLINSLTDEGQTLGMEGLRIDCGRVVGDRSLRKGDVPEGVGREKYSCRWGRLQRPVKLEGSAPENGKGRSMMTPEACVSAVEASGRRCVLSVRGKNCCGK